MHLGAVLGAGLGLLMSGCAQEITLRNRFNPEEVAWSRQPGTATVRGQAFLRTRGGEVRTCAGYEVWLVPASAYAREGHEIYQRTMGRDITITNLDPAARSFVRETRCDAQGNFVFRDLPAGEWFIRARVVWEVPLNAYATSAQGGVLSQPVTTRPGQTSEVIVTR